MPTLDLSIQIVEFTFTHDRYTTQAIQAKTDKNPLIDKIRAQGWIVNPLKVITTSVRGAIHTNYLEELHSRHIPMTYIKKINEKYTHASHLVHHLYGPKQT